MDIRARPLLKEKVSVEHHSLAKIIWHVHVYNSATSVCLQKRVILFHLCGFLLSQLQKSQPEKEEEEKFLSRRSEIPVLSLSFFSSSLSSFSSRSLSFWRCKAQAQNISQAEKSKKDGERKNKRQIAQSRGSGNETKPFWYWHWHQTRVFGGVFESLLNPQLISVKSFGTARQ